MCSLKEVGFCNFNGHPDKFSCDWPVGSALDLRVFEVGERKIDKIVSGALVVVWDLCLLTTVFSLPKEHEVVKKAILVLRDCTSPQATECALYR